MSDKTYDAFCFVGRLLLPALAVLYTTVGKIWNLPYTNEVPATITAVALFINTVMKINSDNYFADKTIVQEVNEE